jgi:muconolactone D-isomerase
MCRTQLRGGRMLFHVEMQVRIPPTLDRALAEQLKQEERAIAQALQRSGVWRHLWRLVGCYANVSIFDVDSPAQLHDILSTLPLFPFMEITVRALCRHPSAIAEDDHLNKPINT